MTKAACQDSVPGSAPTRPTPPSIPSMALNSDALSAEASRCSARTRKMVVSRPRVPSVCPEPISTRPIRSQPNEPPNATHAIPTSTNTGPAISARRTWWVISRPAGTSVSMRAKPKAPATAPSCQYGRPALRPISGRSAGNAPIENVCRPLVRQRTNSRRSRGIGDAQEASAARARACAGSSPRSRSGLRPRATAT